jgi:hypothetical protein
MKRFAVNKWGIASVLLFVGDYMRSEYNFHLADVGKEPLWSRTTNYEICFVTQLAAVICGIIATRRGSIWWLPWVMLPAWGMFVCFLGDL